MQRIRIHYHKTEPLRYTGNLDVHKIWERTLRRAHLPLAYSQGFHPQPRINQACPLPLGMTSRAEMIDVWFEQDISPEQVLSALASAPQPGLEMQSAEIVDLRTPSLPTQVISSDFLTTLLDPIEITDLESCIARVESAETLPRIWKGKAYDLKTLLESIRLLPLLPNGLAQMEIRLSAREGATGRPEEVISAFGLDPLNARYQRTGLVLKND